MLSFRQKLLLIAFANNIVIRYNKWFPFCVVKTMPPLSFAIPNILVLCDRYNIAISNLADAAGISQSTLTRAVKNEQEGITNRQLSLRTFERIASFFNLSTNLLLSHELTREDADAIAKANGLYARPDRMIRKLINNKMPLPFRTGEDGGPRITSLADISVPAVETVACPQVTPANPVSRSRVGVRPPVRSYSADALVNAVKANTPFELVPAEDVPALPNLVPDDEWVEGDVVFSYRVTGEGLPPRIAQGDVIFVRRLRIGEIATLATDTVVLACTQYSQTAPTPEEYGLTLRYLQDGEWGARMLTSVPKAQLPNGLSSTVAPDGRNVLGVVLYSVTQL